MFWSLYILSILNVKYAEKLEDSEIVELKPKLMEFLPESLVFKSNFALLSYLSTP